MDFCSRKSRFPERAYLRREAQPPPRAVDQVELDGALHHVAETRWAKVLNTGKTVARRDGRLPHFPITGGSF
jgi:hypothetical protein